MSVNKVILVGNLGKGPDLRYTSSGTAVCNFSMATSDSWVDKSGQKQERTEWHRIEVWNKLAEICNQYLAKGRQVYVEGQLKTDSWEDSNGNKRYSTKVTARTVQFLGGRPQQQEQRPTQDSYDGFAGPQNGNNKMMDNGVNGNAKDTKDGIGVGAMDKNYNVSTDANFTADDIPF